MEDVLMVAKPTYEQLEERVKKLGKEVLDQKQTEAMLRQSENRYRRIAEVVADYVFMVRVKDGRPIETIHGAACQPVTGYAAEDFKANPRLWIDMVHEEDRSAVEDHANRILSAKEVGPIEHRIIRKDGVMRWVINTPVLRFDSHRKLLSYDGLIRDITEIKHAREMIRYKELFENVVDGVFILSLEGKFLEANDMVYQMTGFSRRELLNHHFKDIVPTEQIHYIEKMTKKIIHDKQVFLELDVESKHGTHIPVEANCRLISYLGTDSILAVARDVTHAKLLEDKLIRSERLAATGQLAASIAHEINSPLQGVTALLNVIKKTYKENGQLTKDIELVKDAFHSIRNTVRKLLDLNRPGKEKKQPINVNDIIEDTVTLARSHLKQNNVTVNLNLSSRVPNIIASPQPLGQVIMNLINNAVDAMTGVSKRGMKRKRTSIGGQINIHTHLRKGRVVIKVADTGPGIADEDLKHIFDPFYTRKISMGMGIGLSVCHGIIEDHDGTIIAKNAPDKGAVFTAKLPTT
jgi:PAS domain S-box-containing protein